ncbi:MAG: hypothetical protein WBA07_12995 [Rivularia sp. (in: cyanobacteria)]|jgi:hypothetical protein
MTKPLGYYTNYIPGKSGLLEYLQETYGSCLQGLSVREKLYLIRAIADNLILRASGDIRGQVHPLSHEIFRLPTSDQEGLIEALIAQLRSM